MFDRFRLSPAARNSRNDMLNFLGGMIVINTVYHLAIAGLEKVLR